MKLSVLKRDFLAYLKRDLGRSEKTVASYGRYLDTFLEHSGITDSTKLSLSAIHSFQQHLREPGVGPGGQLVTRTAQTQNYYRIAFRSFLRYLKRRGVTGLEPREIELLSQTTVAVSVVTQKEITRLRNTMATVNLPIDLRDRAVIELILATGIRVSEVCALSLDDVSFKQSRCVVRTTRGRERVLPLSSAVVQILKTYLRVRRDADTALFVQFGKNAHNATSLRLTPRAVQRILRQRSIAAGITTSMTPKSLRQFLANNLERTGEPLSVIQTRLGHQHSTSTSDLLQRGMEIVARKKHSLRKSVHKKTHR